MTERNHVTLSPSSSAADTSDFEDVHDDLDVDCSEAASDTILFVGDLSRTISEWALAAHFAPFGSLISVELMRDKSSGRILGYAFVKFQNRKEAAGGKSGAQWIGVVRSLYPHRLGAEEHHALHRRY